MNYRMIKATELLKLTSLSIADVGSAVGYEISFISHAPLKYLRSGSEGVEERA